MGGIVFSPNGEPLTGGILGKASCEDAVGKWTDKMAPSPGGTVTLQSFLDDTRRQFGVMDLNHDGFLTAVELAQYRAPFDFRPPRLADAPGRTEEDQEDRDRDRKHLGPRNGHEYNESQPDPVMVADVKMRFKVSLDDFLKYERGNFIRLDSKLKGYLTKADIIKVCDEPIR